MKKKFFLLTMIVLALFVFSTGFVKIDLSASITFSENPEADEKYELHILNMLKEAEESETESETEQEPETSKKDKNKKNKDSKAAEKETEAVTELATETEAATEKETETVTELATEIETETEIVTEPETETETVTEFETDAQIMTVESAEPVVPKPDVDKQFLTKNKWSRCGQKIKSVDKIVIHYLGNPGFTAQENRDFYEEQKDTHEFHMSSNFIVGLDGEIIQCMPEKEVAYCTKDFNNSSISIETCHLDSTGKYLANTYISMVKLTAYLAEKYDVDRENIVRHYDCTGRECPRYYSDHPKAWKRFVNDVMKYRKLCKTQPDMTNKELKENLKGLKDTYKNKKAWKKEQEKA